MKVEITSKQDVKVDGKTYIQGQSVDKEEDEATKKAWIESGVAEEVKATTTVKPEKNG